MVEDDDPPTPRANVGLQESAAYELITVESEGIESPFVNSKKYLVKQLVSHELIEAMKRTVERMNQ